MPLDELTLTLAARWVFPVEGPPIERGAVTIRGGQIERVGTKADLGADLDLGNFAILPGFVNAHTHLELAPLDEGPGGRSLGPEDQIDWLWRVIAQRRGATADDLGAAARRNVAASVAAGTTLVGDLTTAGASGPALAEASTRSVAFAEVLGLNRMRGLQTSQDAWDWIASVPPAGDSGLAKLRPGLAPHAPYSTAGWLYYKAAASRLPLTTHLAEMPEERELLADRGGRLREFLDDLGAWDDAWEPIGPSPADYVRKGELRQADWLIAHGTYLDPSEFWQLRPEAAPEQQRVAIAYCPRTTARFGHGPHPFRAMLARGIIVALGTDSLASAPCLSVLEEARFLFRSDESLGGPLLLTMATLFGAWALRAETVTGSLKPGKSADLAIVALPNRDEADPHRLVLASENPVVATMFAGEFVHGRE